LFVVIVILGIGADDIFVFNDIWVTTKNIKAIKDKLLLRMAYTFRKAGWAMFETSITTAASFIATCITPIMPILSFGMYATIVVTVNYIMIIIFIPSVFLLYERDLKFKIGIWESIQIHWLGDETI
jgi:predicted RND superfamily exporter protein